MYKYYYDTRDDMGRFCKASHNPRVNMWEVVGSATICTLIFIGLLYITL